MKNRVYHHKRYSNFLYQCPNCQQFYLLYKPIILQGQKAMEACTAQGCNNKFMVYGPKSPLPSLLSFTLVYYLLVTHLNLRMSLFCLLDIQFILPLHNVKLSSHCLRKPPPSSIVREKECLIVQKGKVQAQGNQGTFTSSRLCPFPKDNLSSSWLTRDI